MYKPFLKLVAFLLVPCIITDPSLAALIFQQISFPEKVMPIQTVFQDQAINPADVAAQFTDPLNSAGRIHVIEKTPFIHQRLRSKLPPHTESWTNAVWKSEVETLWRLLLHGDRNASEAIIQRLRKQGYLVYSATLDKAFFEKYYGDGGLIDANFIGHIAEQLMTPWAGAEDDSFMNVEQWWDCATIVTNAIENVGMHGSKTGLLLVLNEPSSINGHSATSILVLDGGDGMLADKVVYEDYQRPNSPGKGHGVSGSITLAKQYPNLEMFWISGGKRADPFSVSTTEEPTTPSNGTLFGLRVHNFESTPIPSKPDALLQAASPIANHDIPLFDAARLLIRQGLLRSHPGELVLAFSRARNQLKRAPSQLNATLLTHRYDGLQIVSNFLCALAEPMSHSIRLISNKLNNSGARVYTVEFKRAEQLFRVELIFQMNNQVPRLIIHPQVLIKPSEDGARWETLNEYRLGGDHIHWQNQKVIPNDPSGNLAAILLHMDIADRPSTEVAYADNIPWFHNAPLTDVWSVSPDPTQIAADFRGSLEIWIKTIEHLPMEWRQAELKPDRHESGSSSDEEVWAMHINELFGKEGKLASPGSGTNDLSGLFTKRLAGRNAAFRKRFAKTLQILSDHTVVGGVPSGSTILYFKDQIYGEWVSLSQNLLAYEFAVYHMTPAPGERIDFELMNPDIDRSANSTDAYADISKSFHTTIRIKPMLFGVRDELEGALVSETAHAADHLFLSILGDTYERRDRDSLDSSAREKLIEALDLARCGIYDVTFAERSIGQRLLDGLGFFNQNDHPHERAWGAAEAIHKISSSMNGSETREKAFGLGMVLLALGMTRRYSGTNTFSRNYFEINSQYSKWRKIICKAKTLQAWNANLNSIEKANEIFLKALRIYVSAEIAQTPLLLAKTEKRSDYSTTADKVLQSLRVNIMDWQHIQDETDFRKDSLLASIRESSEFEYIYPKLYDESLMIRFAIDSEIMDLDSIERLVSGLKSHLVDIDLRQAPNRPRAQAIIDGVESDLNDLINNDQGNLGSTVFNSNGAYQLERYFHAHPLVEAIMSTVYSLGVSLGLVTSIGLALPWAILPTFLSLYLSFSHKFSPLLNRLKEFRVFSHFHRQIKMSA